MAGSSAAVAAAYSAAASAVVGVATAELTKPKAPKQESLENKEVRVNDDAALKNAQEMAAKRKGVAANLLSDNGAGGTAGMVATKTALGQ